MLQTEASRDTYDITGLKSGLAEFDCSVFYLPEVTTTMDKGLCMQALGEAQSVGFQRALVLTDHQTAGQGRWGREWLDEPFLDIEMVVVEPFNPAAGDSPLKPPFISRLFALSTCLGLQEQTGQEEIQLRWLDDLTFDGKKLGGHLLWTSMRAKEDPFIARLGFGGNINNVDADRAFPDTDYGAVSLYQISGREYNRQELVLAIMQRWVKFREALTKINDPSIFDYFDDLWQENSALKGKTVRVTGLGDDLKRVVCGQVLSSPLDKGMFIDMGGLVQEVTEFYPETRVEVLNG